MKFYSQAGQDRFALEILANKERGLFLDVGANNPVEINNTFAMESQLWWRGLLVDNSGESMLACERDRTSCFYLTDATKVQDWVGALALACGEREPPAVWDYLSADVDFATLEFLRNFPLNRFRFRVVTVEHDAYRNGEKHRSEIVDILRACGYDILCDVCDQGLCFESWAVSPDLVDMKLAERFRRDKPTEWRGFWK